MDSLRKSRVQKGFIFGVLALTVVLIGGVLLFARSWAIHKESDFSRLDKVIADVVHGREQRIFTLSPVQEQELLLLQKSRFPYIRLEAMMLLAENASHQQLWEEALALWHQVASHKKSFLAPKAQLNIAYILIQQERIEEAYLALESMRNYRHSTINPDLYNEAEFVKAYLLEMLGDLDAALDIYTSLILTLNDENTWYQQAQARLIYHEKDIAI
ncbi:DUF6340 family protein [Entomospira nematocerorum]|uniref:Tetratricopeptide repeat protein n=1 Tax=Entomospira nematocerorum TaxID=2719987 RepID=A0A968GH04_9SPIO|nr:DUF6340 family protein [Entomospira nematocera]NIZ46971.1 hypothetical protein [Entomospira nematocera]WDI34483.1 DUF6340 family protein [Entomospira nematocera]